MASPVDYVFLHGGMQGAWVWEETIAALRAQAGETVGRTLALDVPGCGAKRGQDTAELHIDAVVAELADELAAADVRQALLVGHSQAGTILPRLIATHPGRFGRVVYVSCSAPLPGQSIAAMMGLSRHGQSAEEVGWPLDPATHPLAEQFELMFCNDMTASEKGAFLSRLGHDRWPARVSAETAWRYDAASPIAATFVVCLADGILPPAWQERFAARLGAERIVRGDAGHQVMNTRPHALAEILRMEAVRP